MLSDEEYTLVVVAFNSMDVGGSGLVSLKDLKQRFFPHEHPRVKDGRMAPSAATDKLDYHFGECAADHNHCITFDEFVRYHEKLADEAYDEQINDVGEFTRHTIMGLWRLGDVLLPTGVRPAFPIAEMPKGLYAAALMTLVWVEARKPSTAAAAADPAAPSPPQAGNAVYGDGYVLKGIKEVIRPIFRRGDLPEELQGHFAYPSELAGMAVEYVQPQISIQRWLDFCWEYDAGKFCAVEGIVSARVDLDVLPSDLRQLVLEHRVTTTRAARTMPTAIVSNPMYRKTSSNYGDGVAAECRKIHHWKANTFAGKQYGNQYHGLVGGFFSKMEARRGGTATGMNI